MPRHLEFKAWVAFPIEEVFLFFANPQNLQRIMPAKTDTRIDALRLIAPSARPDSVSAEQLHRLAGVGSEIVTSFRVIPPLPFRRRWIARITAFEWNQFFEDEQVRGPFKSWHHRHELASEIRNRVRGTLVLDKIDYAFGLGPLDTLVEPIISKQIEQMFAQRQRALPGLLGG